MVVDQSVSMDSVLISATQLSGGFCAPAVVLGGVKVGFRWWNVAGGGSGDGWCGYGCRRGRTKYWIWWSADTSFYCSLWLVIVGDSTTERIWLSNGGCCDAGESWALVGWRGFQLWMGMLMKRADMTDVVEDFRRIFSVKRNGMWDRWGSWSEGLSGFFMWFVFMSFFVSV